MIEIIYLNMQFKDSWLFKKKQVIRQKKKKRVVLSYSKKEKNWREDDDTFWMKEHQTKIDEKMS